MEPDTTFRYCGSLCKPHKEGDCGWDIPLPTHLGDFKIPSSSVTTVETDIRVAIPEGFFGLIIERSSIAKRSLFVSGGVIDSGYRGRIHLFIHNKTDRKQVLAAGERVAQLIIVPFLTPNLPDSLPYDENTFVEFFGDTDRGTAGVGSTERMQLTVVEVENLLDDGLINEEDLKDHIDVVSEKKPEETKEAPADAEDPPEEKEET